MLLVDDGSSDLSTQIAKEYVKRYPEKIKYVEHEGHQNRGMSASHNLGIANANGEYIAFLDADDMYLPFRLEKQVTTLNENSGIGMVVNPVIYLYENESRIRRQNAISPGRYPPPSWLEKVLDLELELEPANSCILIRRDLIVKLGGFEDWWKKAWDDAVLWVKAGLETSIYYDAEYIALYRLHDKQSTGKDQLALMSFYIWTNDYINRKNGQFNSPLSSIMDRYVTNRILRCLIEEKKYELANAFVLLLESKTPQLSQNNEWNYLSAYCLHNLGTNLQEALHRYDLALEQGFKEEFWVKYNRGSLYAKLGNTEQAKKDLMRAVGLKPEHDGAMGELKSSIISILRYLLNKNELHNAITFTDQTEQQRPELTKQGEWNYLSALCLHNLGTNLQEALRRYDLALEQGFDEFWVKYNRGSLYAKLGNTEQAKKDLMRAVGLMPEHPGPEQVLQQLTVMESSQETLRIARGPGRSTLIAAENARAGTLDWKLSSPAVTMEIEGYASLTSVNRGSRLSSSSTQPNLATRERARSTLAPGLVLRSGREARGTRVHAHRRGSLHE